MRTTRSLLCLAFSVSLLVGCASGAGFRCQEVGPGPEDFELDLSQGSARLVVSTARRGLLPGAGAIKAVPIGADGALGDARAFRIEGPRRRLHPVGISLVPGHDDRPPLLYVINKAGGPRIERFEVHGETLRPIAPLVDPLLIDPNDLVATQEGHVYVSNVSTKRGPAKLGTALRWAQGSVVHYDGRWSIASGRPISFPNGLAVTGDKLFVAAFMERKVLVFDRDPESGRVLSGIREEIDLPTHPDNLTWLEGDPSKGTLVVAGHGKVRRTALHLFGSKRIPAPSAALLVNTRVDPATTTPLFRDKGRRISAASTALVWRGHLYVSQLRRPQICWRRVGSDR